jgi:hypothetical protein
VTDYNNVHEALMALASEDKREEYARRLEQQINAPRQDKFGGIIDDLAELQAPLMERLREKLTRGEWIAEGFGYESGQPTKIHPRLWQSLTINAWANLAGDRFQQVGGKSRTGVFHTLGFSAAKPEPLSLDQAARQEIVRNVARFFEKLDQELELDAAKRHFFDLASQRWGAEVNPTMLRAAWNLAKLQSARRAPGKRKSI